MRKIIEGYFVMRRSLLVIFFVIISMIVRSQGPTYYLNPDKNLTQYIYDYWTTDDGLPTNSLLHIHQSSNGYLWITGYSGLIRFDGSKFTLFNNSNTDVFISNVIRGITEDNNGTMWFSTQGNGLVSYRDGEFKAYGVEQDLLHLYRAIYADNKNRIWTASPEAGWLYLENDQIHYLDDSARLKNIEVRAITQSKSGAIWFATLGDGLFKYENEELISYKVKDGLIDDWVYALYVDNDDILWIGTSSGVCYFDGKRFHKTLPEIGVTVNCIVKDHYNDLWVGTIDGLYRKKAYEKTTEFINADNGLPNNFIIDFLFDQEGNMWLSHYKGGLARIKDGKFTNYTYEGGLPGEVVNTICDMGDKSFLVGFDNGELVRILNGEIEPYRVTSNFDGNRVRDVMKDSKGNMWFSTYMGLVKKLPNGQEIWYNKRKGFDGTKIRLTFEDSKGNIWVGTRNSGLIKITPDDELIQFDVNDGLSSNLIMSIDEDKEGIVWIGTSEGLDGLNSINERNEVKSFTKQDGIRSDIVFNITPDGSSGIVWFATITGIWAYYNNQFYNITTSNGLKDNSVFDLLDDGEGHLWIPYSGGIMKVQKQDLMQCIQEPSYKFQLRLFDKFDGMANSECNPTAQSIMSTDGKLYFATVNGLSVIDPKVKMINNYVPPVYVENLWVDNEHIKISNGLTFNPGVKRITFNYTALSLYEPEKQVFEYMLDGFESDWTKTSERTVSYTNLSHGEYKFMVRASNNDGVWNMEGSTVTFVIKNRFVESLGFYILILVASFSLVYLVYLWRISQLKNKQETLESLISQRNHEVLEKNKVLEVQKSEIQKQNSALFAHKEEIEKQSKELEIQQEELKESIRSKDKIFSIISHDLRSPLGNIQNMLNLLINRSDQFDDEKKGRILENLLEITKSTFYLLDNLLNWSRSQRGLITYDPQMFLIAPIVNEVIELCQPQARKKNINVVTRINESDLAFGDVNMVKTIFRNLVENAIKFTFENGKVEVFDVVQGDMMEFGVKDSGVGITQELIDRLLTKDEIEATFGTNKEKGSGLGLLICKEFIEKNNGKLRIESTPGQGSIFYFSLKRFQL